MEGWNVALWGRRAAVALGLDGVLAYKAFVLPKAAEESLKQVLTFPLQHAARHLHAVIQTRLDRQIEH